MIRIERVRLPPGMTAFARRESGTVFVYVSTGLSPGQRLAAIREALRAAPDAGWRTGRHPVLLPALAGGAGLRAAPEGRWPYWVLLTAAVAAVASVIAMTVLRGGAPGHAAGPGTTLQPRGRSSPGPGQAIGPGARSSASGPGSVPSGPGGRKPGPRAPTPQTSGTPVPVPTPGASPTPRTSPSPGTSPTQPPPPSGAPTPSSSSSPAPGPSASPSPSSTPKGSSPGACVSVLGVTICV